jgi:hypothetical protein
MHQVRVARDALSHYKWMKNRGLSDHRDIRELAYEQAARVAEAYIKEELLSGRKYIFYGDLCNLLETDRFTVAWILGKLQELNTEEASPLWSAFVGYKYPVFGKLNRILFDIGEPGKSFYSCAEWLQWKMTGGQDEFLQRMRQRGFAELGVR